MGPAFYVMAILGCADSGTACQQVGIAEARYESADACIAATGAILMDNSDVPFPVISAQCRPGKAAIAGATEPNPQG